LATVLPALLPFWGGAVPEGEEPDEVGVIDEEGATPVMLGKVLLMGTECLSRSEQAPCVAVHKRMKTRL